MADSNDNNREDIYRHRPKKRGTRDREQDKMISEQDAQELTQKDWQKYVDARMGRK